MRKTFSLIAAPFAVLLLLGCEGPEGPPGPQGPAGPEGPQGPAGVDQNETCTTCHDDDVDIVVRQLQWQMSKHGSGDNVDRGGPASSGFAAGCAACHAAQGFTERLESGFTIDAPASGFDDPAPINCRTCHQIHTTYTDADFALVTEDPVTLWVNDVEIDLGEANVCAQCHQPRKREPFPTEDGGPFDITSIHWGPHHSTQGGLLAGTGGVELAGSESYGVHIHGNQTNNPEACITCHMAPAVGIEAGGHTWNMEDGDGDPNENGCETSGCHESGLNVSDTDVLHFDHNDLRTYVSTLADALATELRSIGILEPAPGDHAVEGTYTSNEAIALWNWLYIIEDKSLGVHNPVYAVALLTNTLEKLGVAVPPRP